MQRPFAEIPPGEVLWITGLSSAGKTTLAKMLFEHVRSSGGDATLLDGDAVRELMGGDLAHDAEGRLANAYRISRLCRYLSLQGHNVVCATMSLFDEIHQWNRQNLPRYTEVYLKVPLHVLHARDAKGLYRAAGAGTATGVVGADLPFVAPRSPDVVFENTGSPAELQQFARSLGNSLFMQAATKPSVHLKSAGEVYR